MKYQIGAAFLMFLAVIKVLADIAGWGSVSAVAAASNVAPAMKVFTAHQGYETYSSKYQLSVVYRNGERRSLVLNPKNYSNIKGPYNRRNVYGALIAYGPILYQDSRTQAMWQRMVKNSFCYRRSPIASELGFNASARLAQVRIDYLQTRNPQDYPRFLELSCD